MTKEVLEYMNISEGGHYADLTFGEGGHTGAILDAGAGSVLSLDRDPETLAWYEKEGAHRDNPRSRRIHSNFSQLSQWVEPGSLDGILADLGVSTRQIMSGERGFSLRESGPLDMRMDGTQSETLGEMLPRLNVPKLTRILEENADLSKARKYAQNILSLLSSGKLKTTGDLVKAIGGPQHPKAAPIFMALRMMVNQELTEVEEMIPEAIRCLKPGGRLVIITFHSNEDRLVKNCFKRLAGKSEGPEELKAQVRWVNKKALPPSREELRRNKRSRSAKLRCVEKLSASDYNKDR